MSTYGIATSGLGALGQSLKLDQAAHNLANVSTPGFRRDRLSFRERLVEALEDRPDHRYYNALVDRNGGAPFIDEVRFDRRPGGFDTTHRNLDFALQSGGFFTVRDLDSGASFYTRAGNFILDGEGRLVTADGRCEVLTRDGRGITLDPRAAADLRLTAEGALFQGDVEAGRLAVVDFDDYSKLRKQGANLFVNAGGTELPATHVQALQGALEVSSVNPVSEMVEMLKAMRALESNLQMIKFQDATLERAINDAGRVTSR